MDVLDTEALIDARAVGGLQKLVALLGGCALFVEGFDTQVIAYIAPQISRLWHVSSAMLGTLLQADLLGLLIGYIVLAPLSARVGHRRMVIACSALFGALTFITASSTSIEMLLLFRVLTGIGVGGAMPSAVALTGEYFPARWRSTSITMAFIGISLGQSAAGGVTWLLLAPFGFRAVLIAGGLITLVFAALFFALLPELLEYLINRGNNRARAIAILRRLAPDLSIDDRVRLVAGNTKSKVRIGELFEEGRTPGTLLIWLAAFVNLMIFYLLAKWLTELLVRIGLTQGTAITVNSLSLGCGILAAFVVGPLMDRLGPYLIVIGTFIVSALAVMALGSAMTTASVAPIMAASLFVGFSLSGSQKATNAFVVYFYPTALRGAGLGWALGIGRIGGVLGPSIAGLLLERSWAPPDLFYAAAIPMLVGACAIAAVARFYAGKASPAVLVFQPKI